MTEIRLTRDLVTAGYDYSEIVRMQRAGELERLRRGAYVAAAGRVDDPKVRHRQLIEATLPMLSSEAVLSHMSAAVIHGLPVWFDQLSRVHVTRDQPGGGKVRRYVHLHPAPLAAEDVCVVDGRLVTTVARTVVDLARVLPMVRSVPIGDAALAKGADPLELAAVLDRSAGWRGVAAARRAVAFLDPRSQSAGESSSRVVLHQQHFPRPDLQVPIIEAGRELAYGDFGWIQQGVIGEFDGQVKYGRLLKPGQSGADVLAEEKAREDMIRALGWLVVRWIWRDIWQPEGWLSRLRRALESGAARRTV